jgi:hypothetical protein
MGFGLLFCSLWRLLSIEKAALRRPFFNRGDGTPIELVRASVRLWGPRERVTISGAG